MQCWEHYYGVFFTILLSSSITQSFGWMLPKTPSTIVRKTAAAPAAAETTTAALSQCNHRVLATDKKEEDSPSRRDFFQILTARSAVVVASTVAILGTNTRLPGQTEEQFRATTAAAADSAGGSILDSFDEDLLQQGQQARKEQPQSVPTTNAYSSNYPLSASPLPTRATTAAAGSADGSILDSFGEDLLQQGQQARKEQPQSVPITTSATTNAYSSNYPLTASPLPTMAQSAQELTQQQQQQSPPSKSEVVEPSTTDLSKAFQEIKKQKQIDPRTHG